jgi:hypothetical protein
MAEPLTREERAEFMAVAAMAPHTFYAVSRWEATVEAAEAEELAAIGRTKNAKAERDVAEERAEDWMRRGLAAEERAKALRTALRRSGDGLVDALSMSRPDVRYLDSIRVLIDAALAADDRARGGA